LQTASMPQWNAILHVEIISSHRQSIRHFAA
jgi:hypothetical protein